MAVSDRGGWLSKIWVCCVCGWRGPAGSMEYSRQTERLRCDKCKSTNVHPMEKNILMVEELDCDGPLH
jgi:hypothetical protein